MKLSKILMKNVFGKLGDASLVKDLSWLKPGDKVKILYTNGRAGHLNNIRNFTVNFNSPRLCNGISLYYDNNLKTIVNPYRLELEEN